MFQSRGRTRQAREVGRRSSSQFQLLPGSVQAMYLARVPKCAALNVPCPRDAPSVPHLRTCSVPLPHPHLSALPRTAFPVGALRRLPPSPWQRRSAFCAPLKLLPSPKLSFWPPAPSSPPPPKQLDKVPHGLLQGLSFSEKGCDGGAQGPHRKPLGVVPHRLGNSALESLRIQCQPPRGETGGLLAPDGPAGMRAGRGRGRGMVTGNDASLSPEF